MRRGLAVGLARLAMIGVLSTSVHADVIPPDQPFSGFPQDLMSGIWWQWAIDTRAADDPIADPDGAHGVSGAFLPGVFFLAGSGATDPIHRTVSVPADRALSFPLINFCTDNTAPIGMPPTMFTADELRGMVSPMMDMTTGLYLTIDSAPVSGLGAHRQFAEFFYTVTDPDNLITRIGYDPTLGSGMYPAAVDPAVTDGFWVALEPLLLGTHTLTFGAEIPGFFSQDITHTIQVTPEPASLAAVLLLGLTCRRHR